MSSIKIDRQLYNGRPEDTNRLQKEIDTYDLLEKLDMPFVRVDHDVMSTISDAEEVDKLLGVNICKNLFLRNGPKTEFYLLVMPGDKKFVTKNLSKQINSSRLSFAEDSYMEKYLNLTPGSVTILGLMYDKEHKVELLIDKDVLEDEYFACHPCINTSSIKIKTKDVLERFLKHTNHEPTIVEL